MQELKVLELNQLLQHPLVEQGDIDKGERVVCVVTGHLLKDPNTAIDACVDPVQVDADIDKIKEILLNK